jgi:tetratricopeptide (TPR) repeat protein
MKTTSRPRSAVGSILIATLGACALGTAHAEVCGGSLGKNAWQRPLDYRLAVSGADPQERRNLDVVERWHFDTDVETLKRGINGPPQDDIHYTLMAFPNHYRALDAMARFQRLNARPPNATYLSAECYFQRALALDANDPNVYIIYGVHLHKTGQLEGALAAYKQALEFDDNLANAHYNLGLLYFDMKEYANSRTQALRAYELGFPLPGLKHKLERVGQW